MLGNNIKLSMLKKLIHRILIESLKKKKTLNQILYYTQTSINILLIKLYRWILHIWLDYQLVDWKQINYKSLKNFCLKKYEN